MSCPGSHQKRARCGFAAADPHPHGHADDRQGAGLPQRHAGRRGQRGCRFAPMPTSARRSGRFYCCASRGPHRTRRPRRLRLHPDPQPEHPSIALGEVNRYDYLTFAQHEMQCAACTTIRRFRCMGEAHRPLQGREAAGNDYAEQASPSRFASNWTAARVRASQRTYGCSTPREAPVFRLQGLLSASTSRWHSKAAQRRCIRCVRYRPRCGVPGGVEVTVDIDLQDMLQ